MVFFVLLVIILHKMATMLACGIMGKLTLFPECGHSYLALEQMSSEVRAVFLGKHLHYLPCCDTSGSLGRKRESRRVRDGKELQDHRASLS